MAGNKWWFTMLWRPKDSEPWVISPMHQDWGEVYGGVFSRGYDDTASAAEAWSNTTMKFALSRFNNGGLNLFHLSIDYAPERPSFDGFQLPRLERYGLEPGGE